MSTTLIIISLALVASLALYQWLLPKPLPGIPYNAGVTRNILGDLPALSKSVAETGDLMGWLSQQVEKSGQPVTQVFIDLLGPPTLVICDFREEQDVLMHRLKDFDKSNAIAVLLTGVGHDHTLALKTNDEWKGRRRLLVDLMSPAFLHGVAAPNLYDSAMDLIRLWDMKTSFADGRPFHAKDDLGAAVMDAILSFTFGANFDESMNKPNIQALDGFSSSPAKSDDIDAPFEAPEATLGPNIRGMLELNKVVDQVRQWPTARIAWFFIFRDKAFHRALKIKDDCIRRELEKAVQNRERHQNATDDSWMQSALDHIVDREAKLAKKEGRQPEPFARRVLIEAWGFIVAGFDTTSNTLAWGMKHLAANPAIQQRLREDLWAALPAAKREKRAPTAAEITTAAVPYLDACIEEISRVATAVPAIDRDAIRDTTLLGYHVPKGTRCIFLSNGPSSMAPTPWTVDGARRSAQAREAKVPAWPEADIGAFKPERWLVKRADGTVAFDPQAGPTLAFGGGVRACYGRRLALLSMRLIVTLVVWNYELLRCPEELAGFEAVDHTIREPQKCFVRLRKVVY